MFLYRSNLPITAVCVRRRCYYSKLGTLVVSTAQKVLPGIESERTEKANELLIIQIRLSPSKNTEEDEETIKIHRLL